MTDQAIVFKNSKTGKVEQFQASEIDAANFQNFIGSWGLRVLLKGGVLHRFAGFKESDKEKLSKFFNSSYKTEVTEKDISCKGWNWGTAAFNGSVLSFDIGDKSAFEVPLNHVSQCLTGKNEITMEFHQNDDAPVSLMEMRFFIPPSELAGDVDAVEAFQKQVMNKASVINVSGDAIAIFREIQCLTPRYIHNNLNKKWVNKFIGSVLVVVMTSKYSNPSSNCTVRRSTTKYQCRRSYASSSCRTRIVARCFLSSVWIHR